MSKFGISIALILLGVQPIASAATLKPETKAAWDEYIQQATAAMQARLQPGAHFLWIDDHPDRAEAVRTRTYIAPIGKHIPMKVPSGLIHDWIGVSFIPDAKIDDILHILRDYDRYKDIYRPGVLDSAYHSSDGQKDSFFLRLANRSVIAKTALDTDVEATYFKVDEHRCYSISNTVRIQEIDKFGTPEQRVFPEDQGTGLIWRLFSITRLEERDGGVYAELEAIVLSRDIPAAFRLMVNPIVRRVSRESMATSLRQTRVAVDARMLASQKESLMSSAATR